jgi:DUF2975 family protein
MLILSRRVLRVLVVLNWLFMALFALIAAVLLSPVGGERAVAALSLTYAPDQALLLVRAATWLMVIAIAVGIAVHILFRRMLAIVATAVDGDPFIRANAGRLRAIGWALLAIQLLDLVFGALSTMVAARTGEGLGWSPSVAGWISVLMLFVLARVFEQGSRMRDELAMTV